MSAQPQASEGEWTIGRLLSWTAEYLSRHGVEESRLASEVLLAHATDRRRIDLYARFEEVPAPAQLGRFRAWVKRAANHEPIAYLVGEKEFFSLPFTVTPDVLIPRPETETLVEAVLDHCQKSGPAQPQLLDVGTGSGCIAVAVLGHLQQARVVASDVSQSALEVAAGNAERHGVSDRLTLIRADRLALPDDVVPDGGFDVLMSNPPYVAADAMDGLDASVRGHEPRAALTDEDDGLSFYRSLVADGPRLLAPGGIVIIEVGDGQAETVIQTVAQAGTFVHRETRKDHVSGRERVLLFSLR